MFSDVDIQRAIIEGDLVVDPFDRRLLQPASLDLRLGKEYLVINGAAVGHIDPAIDQRCDLYSKRVAVDGYFYVNPGTFIIATSMEHLELSRRVVAKLEGKSSLGRLGLLVHATAGFFDPGFKGEATLEIANISGVAIKLYVGMPVCQLSVEDLLTPTDNPYRGKYLNQSGPQGSRYFKNFEPGGIMCKKDEARN